MRIRKIGNYLMIVLDIEVDGSISTFDGHSISVQVEESIRSEIENVFDIMIHIEPAGFKHKEEVYGINPGDLIRAWIMEKVQPSS